MHWTGRVVVCWYLALTIQSLRFPRIGLAGTRIRSSRVMAGDFCTYSVTLTRVTNISPRPGARPIGFVGEGKDVASGSAAA
eukprot:224349-Amorphochlora_amoeboformis.AAC.1